MKSQIIVTDAVEAGMSVTGEDCKTQRKLSISKNKTSWLVWFGTLLMASGIVWAAMFMVNANRTAWTSTPDMLLGIICVVQALFGFLVIMHTQRTPPV